MEYETAFIDVFRLAALQAGAVARHLRGKVKAERKGGHNPESEALTAVDLATQDVILHALKARLPDVAVDAEEDTPLAHAFAPPDGRPLVVIDPVDGTLNYIRGSDDYAVMGALIRDGVFTASVIYFPEHGTLYHAVRGGGCHGGPLGAPRRLQVSTPVDLLMVSPGVRGAAEEALGAVGIPVERCRCSAVDSSAPATGRARAAVSDRRPDRRRALGYLLTVEAGGVVHIGGRRWSGEDPATLPAADWAVIAESEETAARVADALRRA